jgi:tRNA A-37 threonylcarbamoyl transferase component Bud32
MTEPGDPLGTEGLTDPLGGGDPLIGKVLAEKYKIVRRLGGGGMGSVYEAQHTVIGRRLAVKLLHPQLASDEGVLKRFLNEARAAGMLGHPNIVESIDMGRTADGWPFLVLELLDGNDLEREIAKGGPLPVGRAVRIALQVAAALSAAHAKGIVHRDLKPENVFVLQRGGADHVKVLDFGISKFVDAAGPSGGTRTGAIMGTPGYMAPEQITDASRADARADVYALGIILYQSLAGGLPYHAETLPSLFIKILQEEPAPLAPRRPDLPAPLVLAVEKAIAKKPDERFQSMDELAAAIEPYASLDAAPMVRASVPVAVATASTMPGATTATHEPGRRTTWPLRAALAAVALVVVGGGVWIALRAEEPAPALAPKVETAAPVARVGLAVSSPDPGAEATLRGTRMPLPLAQEVALGTVPEALEVTAPGCGGRRYWITLDRPVQLVADLPSGRGLVDATDVERRVALGEAPPVAEPGTAASTSAPRRTRRARAPRDSGSRGDRAGQVLRWIPGI